MDIDAVSRMWPWQFGNFLLGTIRGLSIAGTGDKGTIGMPYAQYRVRKVVVRSPNIDVSAGALGVWTAASQGGTNLVANATLTGLTTTLKYLEMTITAAGNNTILAGPGGLFVNTGTGVAGGTVDIDVYGDLIPGRM